MLLIFQWNAGETACTNLGNTMKQYGNKRRGTRGRKPARAAPKSLPLTAQPPLMNSRRCVLAFASRMVISESAAGSGAYNFYRLNGPYDPDTAVLSDSTPGLAALAVLYRSMRVWKTTVSFNGAVYATSVTPAAMISLVPTAFQPVLPANPRIWCMQRDAITKQTGPMSISSGGYAAQISISKTFDIPRVMNILPSQYRDEADFACPTNSNPTRQAYVAITIDTCAGTSPVNCFGIVRISYEIEFYDPYPLS